MNYENKELWNTDMQVGKPYKATILKNYHILLYVHKSYSIVTFTDAPYFISLHSLFLKNVEPKAKFTGINAFINFQF